MSRKFKLALGLAALTAVLASASLAWACTAQFYLNQVAPSAAPARATVSLSGSSHVEGPVEIRWNTANGPRVDTTTLGSAASFASQITVPDVAPGVYYLVVVSGGQKLASAPLQVTDPSAKSASPAASNDLWAGFDIHQPSIDGLGGVSKAPSGPKAGLVLGVGLLAAGAIAAVSTLAVIARVRRRSAKSES